MEIDESASKPDCWEVAKISKIVFELGFPLIASIIAIISGSVQFASQIDKKTKKYLNLSESYCAITMIVTGCIILASVLFRLAIRYFFKNYINWINKIVNGLIVCCCMLLFVAIVLSFSDIKTVNDTDETAMISVLDNYVENGTTHNGSVDDDIGYAYIGFDADLSFYVDMLQQTFKCCGVVSYTDWSSTDWGRSHPSSVPDSCCQQMSENCGINYDSTNYIFTQGCFTVVAGKVNNEAVISVVTSIVVILLDAISVKHKGILDFCPDWLKEKVMNRNKKNPENSDEQGRVIEQLTINLNTGPLIENAANLGPSDGRPPSKTVSFKQVPITGSITGSLHINTNSNECSTV